MDYNLIVNLVAKLGPTTSIALLVLGAGYYTKIHKSEHTEILRRLKGLEANDESVSERLERNEKLMLKMTIVDNNMPKSARLEAYDEYRRIGGNSWVKDYVEENLLNK